MNLFWDGFFVLIGLRKVGKFVQDRGQLLKSKLRYNKLLFDSQRPQIVERLFTHAKGVFHGAIIPVARCLLPVACLLLPSSSVAQTNKDTPQDFNATSVNYFLKNPPQEVPSQSISVQRLDNPGACSYFYWVVATFPVGNATPSGPAAITNGACTLSSGNRVSWTTVTGATGYDLLRTSTFSPPAGNCACAVATALATPTATDTGSLGAYTVTTFNLDLRISAANAQCSANLSGLTFTVTGTNTQAFTITSDGVLHQGNCTGPVIGGTSFPLLAPNGSAAVPSYSFALHTGDGMFWTNLLGGGNSGLGFAVDGSLVAGIDNVGELHVIGGLSDNSGGSGSINVQKWNFNGSPSSITPLTPRSGSVGTSSFPIKELVTSAQANGIRTITANDLQSGTDFTILCDATAGPVTLTLFGSPLEITGTLFAVKKIDSTANTCTVNGNGFNIEGGATFTLSTQNAAILMQFNGTNWYLLGQTAAGGVTTINGTSCAVGGSCTVASAPSGAAGGDLSGTYPNPTVTSLTHPTINGGIVNNGTGFQHVRQAYSCTVGTGTFDGCNFTLTLPGTFADTNYTAGCSVEEGNIPQFFGHYGNPKTTTSFLASVFKLNDGGANTSISGTLDCWAVHD